jgi:pimeloyl-ACP methyl ester carboxylesterase
VRSCPVPARACTLPQGFLAALEVFGVSGGPDEILNASASELPPVDGFLFLDRDRFHASFAGALSAEQAAFMADSQVPWGVEALGGTISEPAWRSKPSWYMITTGDLMIPPDAQRTMSQRIGATVAEVDASHCVYVSQPAAVADLITQAAAATAKETSTVA